MLVRVRAGLRGVSTRLRGPHNDDEVELLRDIDCECFQWPSVFNGGRHGLIRRGSFFCATVSLHRSRRLSVVNIWQARIGSDSHVQCLD